MSMASSDNIIAAQVLYLRRLTDLKQRVDRIVKLGEKNTSLEEAAYETLEEIDVEVSVIQESLKLLAYLQRG